jgi:hypothetical protein
MRSYIIFGIGLSLIAGCADNRPGMSYKIIVDNSIDVAIVEAAGASWEAAIPELKLSYEVASCNLAPELQSVCIFIDNGNPPPDSQGLVMAHTDLVNGSSATIHMYASSFATKSGKLPFMFSNSLTHEIGHAISNRGSHIAKGNMMYYATDGNVESKLEQGDIEYFWSER